ncbi:LuxR family transcriptional regulator [Pseudarthrobacter sp. NPDC058362]|uniref:LuxR family transcriptional regulator n=1 Tax=Pseudarthrobacter sp. NPDC058362 TaxID=3346458 RepID=UPI003650CBF2
MHTIVRTILLALTFAAAPALAAGAAHAAPQTAHLSAAASASQANTAETLVPLAGYTPTPSPGDTASTGPANPGTGESAQKEASRLDFAPWVIGGIALATLIVVLVWWRRRGKTTIV